MPRLTLATAATKLLSDIAEPVVSSFNLAAALFKIVGAGEYDGVQLRTQNTILAKKRYNSIVTGLVSRGIIKTKVDASKAIFFELPLYKTSSVDEILCIIDPFCYVSHLSAMYYYGLTIRIPESVFVTTKRQAEWKVAAQKIMVDELGDAYDVYREQKLPVLTKPNIEKIKNRVVKCYATKSYGAFKRLREKHIAIATIGQTFLDMLREPGLCGGIFHVVETYREHADKYAKTIIEEINSSGHDIDKVRAGYILNELCGINSEIIDSWLPLVQRGGSRKLDASSDYSHVYSEKWSLSINVDGVADE